MKDQTSSKLAALLFVLGRESAIDFDGLRKQEGYINYPQWLATLQVFGWKNSMNLGSEDKAALFPLNVTVLRMHGIMKNRKKFFAMCLADAKMIRNKLSLPDTIDLQIAVFLTSNIWMDWDTLKEKERETRYQQLWVNFKGSLWIELQRKKDES